jgi:hypothetical protein
MDTSDPKVFFLMLQNHVLNVLVRIPKSIQATVSQQVEFANALKLTEERLTVQNARMDTTITQIANLAIVSPMELRLTNVAFPFVFLILVRSNVHAS